ncbi:MAG TPA: hypothetical protein PK413_00825 [Thermoanaerobaculia bacterium]|nr:hypothetical protein [Thermoanaerobaculia bacterium]
MSKPVGFSPTLAFVALFLAVLVATSLAAPAHAAETSLAAGPAVGAGLLLPPAPELRSGSSCDWSLYDSGYGQAGCSGGNIGDYPSYACTPATEGAQEWFSGCAQFIDWYQTYLCVCS